jgi:hypothetical protein
MTLKLTPSESRTLNKFADLYAQKRKVQAILTPIQNELRKLQVEVKAILDAKGKQLPIASIKQRKNIELATTRSQLAYTQSFVEGYYVDDSVRDTVKASAIK